MDNNAPTPPAAQPPKPGQRRAELIRQRQAAERERQLKQPAPRGCGGCRGRRITR